MPTLRQLGDASRPALAGPLAVPMLRPLLGAAMMTNRSFLHQIDLILCWTTAVLVIANVFGADISWHLIALCSILNMLVLRYTIKPRTPTR